ncbi:hypothetical protein F0562_003289 [Nyssa sinensis]|uniref:C2H2-type domain-containing protein n=1 Tax=Nyssa sinensis TaxID=561372 RepID=A0A5J5BY26_9ASTE|nr:hypothetical protein F0562_003289 [Nyssa sinensis]
MSWLLNSMQPHISRGFLFLKTAYEIWTAAAQTYSQAKGPEDSVIFQQLKEKERVYDFLAGLNDEYDQSRGQVLGRDPFPTLQQAYAFIQQEESRRGVMIHTPTQDRSALATFPQKDYKAPQPRVENKGGNSEKGPTKCDSCGKRWHTRDNYWKLHGHLNTGRGGGKTGSSRSHAHLTEASDTHASTEYADHLTSYTGV